MPSLLRTLLAERQGRVPLAEAARHLRMSVRSLQRRLDAWQTSSRREVAVVRVELAKRLLLEAEMSLAEIACATGFTSPQHFSDTFRRTVGCPPGMWRHSNRRGSAPTG